MLTVTNQGDSATIIQADLLSWRQEKGRPLYSPSGDLLVVPPLFELGPGEKQLVRVGMRKAAEPASERAYRLYLGEVPDRSRPKEQTVRVLVRISMPVFVHSPLPEAPALQWRASCAGKRLRLEVANAGNGHAKLLGFTLEERPGKKPLAQRKALNYLLAGTERSWTVEVPECPAAGSTIGLSVQMDEGPLHAQVVLEE